MGNATLETLPPELILLIAKRLDVDNLWNLGHTCRRLHLITRKLARPTLALRYPSLNSTFAEEHHSKLSQILLAHKATHFQCKFDFQETGNYGVYSAKKLWLRSMIVNRLPHLAIRVASEMEPEEAQSPMNGLTIDRLALQLGQDTVAKFIKNM